MQMLLTFVLWIMIGSFTAYFAQQRGRDPFAWFLIGMLLGIIGLILVFILPRLNTADEEEGEMIELVPETPKEKREDGYKAKDWFFLDKQNKQQGPVSFDALRRKWMSGDVLATSYVWSEGMPSWNKIEEIPDLQDLLQY